MKCGIIVSTIQGLSTRFTDDEQGFDDHGSVCAVRYCKSCVYDQDGDDDGWGMCIAMALIYQIH